MNYKGGTMQVQPNDCCAVCTNWDSKNIKIELFKDKKGKKIASIEKAQCSMKNKSELTYIYNLCDKFKYKMDGLLVK